MASSTFSERWMSRGLPAFSQNANPAAASASTGAKGVFATITQTASVGALAILRSLWLFYPIFVGFLLLIARLLYKWVTKPRF